MEFPFVIPPHGRITACPKCGASSEALRTSYHETAAGYSSLNEVCRKFIRNLQRQEELPPEGFERWEDYLGEHLCRRCADCRYGWIEHVASDVDVYALPEDP